jgi:hypothetical protein
MYEAGHLASSNSIYSRTGIQQNTQREAMKSKAKKIKQRRKEKTVGYSQPYF